MLCPKCGGEILEDSLFCDLCGKAVSPATPGGDRFADFLKALEPRVASSHRSPSLLRKFITFDNGLVLHILTSPSKYSGLADSGFGFVRFALFLDERAALLKLRSEQVEVWWQVFRGFRRVRHLGPLSPDLAYVEMEKIALRLGGGRWATPSLDLYRWRKRARYPDAPEWRVTGNLSLSTWFDHGADFAATLDDIANLLMEFVRKTRPGAATEGPPQSKPS